MRRIGTVIGSIGLMLAIGACSMDFDNFRPMDSSIFRPKRTALLRDAVVRPIAAEDMVDAAGQCAAMAAAAPAPVEGSEQAMPPPAGVPLIAGGVALEMTECDVVSRIGPPEQVNIGQNERSERTATLTYIRSSRPGIYQFTAGRLTAIERAPEPPAPARPQRQQRQAPKRAAS